MKPAIKKAPAAWYVAATVLMALYVSGLQGWLPLPVPVRSTLFLLLQKGFLAVALFAVAMFIGAFPRDGRPRKHLMAIRAELSIIACILVCGHIVVYCLSYVPLVLEAGIINPFVAVGLAVAAAITVLLIVLGVTSFGSVKVRMSKQAWVCLLYTSVKGSAPRTLHIVGAIAALGLTFVMANAYFVSAGIPAWASWQTFLLFILGNLAMGAALLTLFEPSLAKNGTYLITAAALGVLAIVAIALEAVHFAGVGANMILLAIGAVVVAAAAMLQSMAKSGKMAPKTAALVLSLIHI